MRFLFDKYPDMISDYKFLYMKTFDENRDDWAPGRKSRIGDAIAVFTGPDLLAKVAKYDEDHVFHLSKRWRITIKGGQRHGARPQMGNAGDQSTAQFSANFANDLMRNLSPEAATEASNNSAPADDP